MKHLQDTPWWICDPGDENYCAYVDTDSNYFHAEPLLRHRFSNFDEMSDEEKDKLKAKIKAGEVGFIEQLLREQMDVRGEKDAGVMKRIRSKDPEASLRFDHFIASEENRNRVSGGKIKQKLDPEKVFITENEFSEGN